ATYYFPGGGFGACGWVIQNTDFVVALGPDTYAGGSHCGQTINVQYNGITINVQVADLCPGCQGANGIDLSSSAMAAIDPNYVNDGKVTVNW
ncbi:RlpA-like double-psi beta-barrel-protein domain-containing protein-containing protein, partial [Mycena galopus ATCC 62051]